MSHIPSTHQESYGIVQCVYYIQYQDGTEWVGAGDCSRLNSKDPYINYPTSVSESRAEARALRKSLGINILSFEELESESSGESQLTPDSKIDRQVVKALQTLCDRLKIDVVEIVENVVVTERKQSIFSLSDLTTLEGQKAMEYLNSKSKTLGKRESRKEELKKVIGE